MVILYFCGGLNANLVLLYCSFKGINRNHGCYFIYASAINLWDILDMIDQIVSLFPFYLEKYFTAVFEMIICSKYTAIWYTCFVHAVHYIFKDGCFYFFFLLSPCSFIFYFSFLPLFFILLLLILCPSFSILLYFRTSWLLFYFSLFASTTTQVFAQIVGLVI